MRKKLLLIILFSFFILSSFVSSQLSIDPRYEETIKLPDNSEIYRKNAIEMTISKDGKELFNITSSTNFRFLSKTDRKEGIDWGYQYSNTEFLKSNEKLIVFEDAYICREEHHILEINGTVYPTVVYPYCNFYKTQEEVIEKCEGKEKEKKCWNETVQIRNITQYNDKLIRIDSKGDYDPELTVYYSNSNFCSLYNCQNAYNSGYGIKTDTILGDSLKVWFSFENDSQNPTNVHDEKGNLDANLTDKDTTIPILIYGDNTALNFNDTINSSFDGDYYQIPNNLNLLMNNWSNWSSYEISVKFKYIDNNEAQYLLDRDRLVSFAISNDELDVSPVSGCGLAWHEMPARISNNTIITAFMGRNSSGVYAYNETNLARNESCAEIGCTNSGGTYVCDRKLWIGTDQYGEENVFISPIYDIMFINRSLSDSERLNLINENYFLSNSNITINFTGSTGNTANISFVADDIDSQSSVCFMVLNESSPIWRCSNTTGITLTATMSEVFVVFMSNTTNATKTPVQKSWSSVLYTGEEEPPADECNVSVQWISPIANANHTYNEIIDYSVNITTVGNNCNFTAAIDPLPNTNYVDTTSVIDTITTVALNSPIPAQSRQVCVNENNGEIYVFWKNDTSNARFSKSTDNVTWTTTSISSNNIERPIIDCLDDKIVIGWVETNTLYKISDDGGDSFSGMPTLLPSVRNGTTEIHFVNSTTVYWFIQNLPNLVIIYRSDNSGATWSQINNVTVQDTSGLSQTSYGSLRYIISYPVISIILYNSTNQVVQYRNSDGGFSSFTESEIEDRSYFNNGDSFEAIGYGDDFYYVGANFTGITTVWSLDTYCIGYSADKGATWNGIECFPADLSNEYGMIDASVAIDKNTGWVYYLGNLRNTTSSANKRTHEAVRAYNTTDWLRQINVTEVTSSTNNQDSLYMPSANKYLIGNKLYFISTNQTTKKIMLYIANMDVGTIEGNPPAGENTTKGLIPMNSGNPFYTITQNPNSSIYNAGNHVLTWQVNATGEIGSKWTFFVNVSLTGNNSIFAVTPEINITIVAPVGEDTCTYSGSNNFNINGADYCKIDNTVVAGTLYCYGVGEVTFIGAIDADKIILDSTCRLSLDAGGKFK